jgi:transcription initiation factor TFIID subunit TAF12
MPGRAAGHPLAAASRRRPVSPQFIVEVGLGRKRHSEEVRAVQQPDSQDLAVAAPRPDGRSRCVRTEPPIPAQVTGCSWTGAPSCCHLRNTSTVSRNPAASGLPISIGTYPSNPLDRRNASAFPQPASLARGQRRTLPLVQGSPIPEKMMMDAVDWSGSPSRMAAAAVQRSPTWILPLN